MIIKTINKLLMGLIIIMCNNFNIYSQGIDSVTNVSNNPVLNHAVGFHFGTSPIAYGGMLGVDYRYKNKSFEINYFGINRLYYIISLNPFLYSTNSFSKVSFSSNLLFSSKRKPKKSFSCGLTLIHLWDNYSDPDSQFDALYGLNGYNIYPSIGYYNENMGKSFFNFKIKLGLLPVFPNERRVNSFQFLPVLDLNIGFTLFRR